MALYPDFILSADEELVGVGSALRVYDYEASVAADARAPAAPWIHRFGSERRAVRIRRR